jgi:glycosyltransferase involved in cell wall biosynthesis
MKRCSVCLPSYNGDRYIKAQIESILRQLGDDDELIISDDSSTDGTTEIVKGISDRRIYLLEHETFRNPVGNIENALLQACGKIIFLSDQDDLWVDSKITRVMKIFDECPDITLVASDAAIIDGEGRTISKSYYSGTVRFTPGVMANIVKNRYLGCTLAFRRSMFRYVLPFPRDIPMHDVWIGIMNRLYGNVHYIDEPLIGYRRHDGNFSPAARTGLKNILRWRWNLTRSLAARMIKVMRQW